MFRLSPLLSLVALVIGGGGIAATEPNPKLSPAIVEALQKGKFELYSLDPEIPDMKPKDDFHGWRVLGKATIKDAKERDTLAKAFLQGVEDNDGKVIRGFQPRHGLRVTYEQKTYDFVFGGKYLQTMVYEGDDKKGFRVLHTSKPVAAFDEAVKTAGLKTADPR